MSALTDEGSGVLYEELRCDYKSNDDDRDFPLAVLDSSTSVTSSLQYNLSTLILVSATDLPNPVLEIQATGCQASRADSRK